MTLSHFLTHRVITVDNTAIFLLRARLSKEPSSGETFHRHDIKQRNLLVITFYLSCKSQIQLCVKLFLGVLVKLGQKQIIVSAFWESADK